MGSERNACAAAATVEATTKAGKEETNEPMARVERTTHSTARA